MAYMQQATELPVAAQMREPNRSRRMPAVCFRCGLVPPLPIRPDARRCNIKLLEKNRQPKR